MLRSFLYVAFAAVVISWGYGYTLLKKSEEPTILDPGKIDETAPPCLQMYFNIEKYSEQYGVPRNYAFGIAHAETGYRGPFHWSYRHDQTSTAGAVGPMQIIPRYAGPFVDEKFTSRQLKTDIKMNVVASMKMLKRLHQIHGDWRLAFGAYNTGRPCVNGYAIKVAGYRPDY
jgi:soluble lytic murein transglycosylase-like protein